LLFIFVDKISIIHLNIMEELNSIEEELKHISECYYQQHHRHTKSDTLGI
jgi:hypothetical protein